MDRWLSAKAFLIPGILFGCGTTAPKRPLPRQAGDYAAAIAYLDEYLSGEIRAGRAQGLSVALIDDQRILWSKGFGLASREPRVPAATGTIYRIGSISKLFTATALLKLREQGKVDLDKPLTWYLPEFTIKNPYPDAPPITLRHLLTHHSGLPRDHYKGSLAPRPEEAMAGFDALPTILAEDYLQAPPGALFSYSNVGFGLLGQVVARAGGIGYPGYIQDSLLGPMGMTHASVLRKPELDPWMAKITVGKKELSGSEINMPDLSAGALYASAEDLARFMEMIFADGESGGHRILAKESLDTMLVRQNAGIAADEDVRIGLGYFLSEQALGGKDSLEIFWHGGSVPGFQGCFSGSRALKIGVVVLVDGGDAMRIGNEAMASLVDAKLGRKVPPRRPRESEEALWSPARMDSLAGKYGVQLDGMGISRVDLARDGMHLSARIDGKKKATLIPSGHDTFRIRNLFFGFLPLPLRGNGLYMRPIDDRKWAVGTVGGGPLGLAERITPDSVPSVWRKRAGRYACLNPDITPFRPAPDTLLLAYAPREGLMKVGWNGAAGIPLKILSATDAVSYGRTECYRAGLAEGREDLEFSGFKFGRIDPPVSMHP